MMSVLADAKIWLAAGVTDSQRALKRRDACSKVSCRAAPLIAAVMSYLCLLALSRYPFSVTLDAFDDGSPMGKSHTFYSPRIIQTQPPCISAGGCRFDSILSRV